MSNVIYYDPSTDSIYITLRKGVVTDTDIHDEREYAVDIGADGEVMGYDIQHASRHADVIAEALGLLRQHVKNAA